jgi:pimeloyl-ACP methyl ester carboxylesterase
VTRGFAANPQDGIRLAYETAGNGEPLLLVHGTALSKATWRGLGYQRELARDFTVITMDMRGHGRSSKPQDTASYTMAAFSQDVLAVLDALGIAAAHYAGYSFGARVGLALAARHPGRLLSLTTIGGGYRSLAGQIGELFFPEWDRALHTGGMAAFVDGWEQHAGHPLDPVTRHAFMANDAGALLAYLRQGEAEPGLAEDTLRTITTPTLLLAGSKDVQRHLESRTAAGLMPHAVFHELAGYGHSSSLVPMREVTGRLRAFIAAQRG